MKNVLFGDEREQERTFVADGYKWPMWPWLPVKRYGTEDLIGMVHWNGWDEDPAAPIKVYLVNMFALGEIIKAGNLEEQPKKEYLDLDGFFDDGWRAD